MIFLQNSYAVESDDLNTAIKSLRVLTFNMWSGLNYKGTFRIESLENTEHHQKRLQSFLTQVNDLNPDIIFLQEVNPVDQLSRKIGNILGYDEIHQVCLGGIRIGPLGMPVNLKEGMSILAKPHLNLRLQDIKKLSGSFGLYGDIISIHFDESVFGLIGKITVSGQDVVLLNTHLRSVPPPDQNRDLKLNELIREHRISDHKIEKTYRYWGNRYKLKMLEVERLILCIKELDSNTPLILAGDFNLVPSDSLFTEIQSQSRLISAASEENARSEFSWNPLLNPNIRNSMEPPADSLSDIYNYIDYLHSSNPLHIDHILYSHHFSRASRSQSLIVLNKLYDGVMTSDHFGVYTELLIDSHRQTIDYVEKKTEAMPILSYDTDTGFGYGAKLFVRNLLNKRESLDLILFNSTEGEKWYRTVISVPDFELRQMSSYPFALDITADFNKWIAYKFYGTGNNSRFEAEKSYTHEVIDFSLAINHGLTKAFVVQYGLRYKEINNHNLDLSSFITLQTKRNYVKYRSFFFSMRYDSRNSYIDPVKGIVAKIEIEKTLSFSDFHLWKIWFQYYKRILFPKTIFAFRLGIQSTDGPNLPVQLLLPIGGNNTLRGFPQDRFLDKSSLLMNAELRFVVYKRLGGIFGFDAGMVDDHILGIFDQDLHTNYVIGLRYYLDTFIVRLDIGLSDETIGFFLNFGHIF